MEAQTELIKFETPELTSIESSKADKIRATFEPMAEMLTDFESAYGEIIAESEEEITKELTARAKRLRLDIGKVRVKTEKLRKTEKEEYLRAGKAIDGVSNILKWAVTDKENRLKEIEDHFEIMERKRLEALQAERVEALSQYVENAQERDLSSMEDDVWNAYIATKKKEYEDRLEAERKAEQERIEAERKEKLRWEREKILRPYYDFFKDKGSVHLAEMPEDTFKALVADLREKKAAHDAEQERIRKENERLKKEAEERARQEKIEAEKRDKEEAERKAKEEKERKAYEEKLRKEAEERARLEAEMKRQEKERKAKEAAEAEEKARAEKAAKNKAHRAKVNREIAAKLSEEVGLDDEQAKTIIRLVVKGQIPHMSVNY